MITRLKRGYEWSLSEDGRFVQITVWDKFPGETPPVVPTSVRIDRVGIYSLASFLIRVLRRRRPYDKKR
jgi:hypothetical protein